MALCTLFKALPRCLCFAVSVVSDSIVKMEIFPFLKEKSGSLEDLSVFLQFSLLVLCAKYLRQCLVSVDQRWSLA